MNQLLMKAFKNQEQINIVSRERTMHSVSAQADGLLDMNLTRAAYLLQFQTAVEARGSHGKMVPRAWRSRVTGVTGCRNDEGRPENAGYDTDVVAKAVKHRERCSQTSSSLSSALPSTTTSRPYLYSLFSPTVFCRYTPPDVPYPPSRFCNHIAHHV